MQNSLGIVTVTTVSGRDTLVAGNDVRSIMDEKGRDRTKQVLVDSEVVRVGDAAKAEKKYVMPASEKGTYLSVHAGPAWPGGAFDHAASTGFEVDASAHWRRGKRTELGVILGYASFGGTEDFDNYLALGSGGEVDQISFRSWGGSLFARWLIFRQPRFDPFIYLAYGVGSFTTSLDGPGASGSNSDVAFHSELGIGVRLKTSGRTSVELVAATAGRSTGNGQTDAGNYSVYSSGDYGQLLLKVGLVRRYGGGD